jgi:hypothetical protein
LSDTVLPVNVAALPVPGATMSALRRPPPVPEAVLLVRALLVSVAAPKFRMPPPDPTALPWLSMTDLSVSLPVLATSAIRKAGVPIALERVMRFWSPVSVMTVVMVGSPSGPFAPLALLVVRL